MIERKKSTGKKPAGAHVVLHRLLKAGNCNSIQAVLLCKRTQDAPIHPGYWALFGGKLKKNKSPKETVQLELDEELEANDINFKIFKMKKLCDIPIRRENGKPIVSYFSAPLEIDMDKLKLKRYEGKVEGEGIGWFTAEETHHLMMRPEDRVALVKFFLKNGI